MGGEGGGIMYEMRVNGKGSRVMEGSGRVEGFIGRWDRNGRGEKNEKRMFLNFKLNNVFWI